MKTKRKLSARGLAFQAFFLALACFGLLVLLVKRPDAQPAPPSAAPPGAPRPPLALSVSATPAAPPPASASASAHASAAASASAAPEKGDKKGGDKDDKKDERLPADDALDSALLGPKGGVPTHKEGKFRSPFASPGQESVSVKVGLVLQAIDGYDVKLGTFEATFDLSLTSERPMPDVHLTFPNGKVDTMDKIADRPTFKLFHVVGTFKSHPDLRTYPFDTQELRIEIEDKSRGVDQMRLAADQAHTHLDVGFEVVGWDVKYVEGRSLGRDMPARFDNDDLYYGRYIFRLAIERYGTNALFTVYVPALVIVLISLIGMWVPPNEMEVRANAGAPMLAAAVLFHFSLTQALPATSYLTPADKLMIGVYVSLLLGMISTWAFFLIEEERWDRAFRIARVLVPVLTAGVMTTAIFA